jgi:NADH-quinone oxidoreductase subunit H|tara:strand:+ start:3024 stop:4013 length:990 start_codon:yes stop_codon:yes gene_type:complete
MFILITVIKSLLIALPLIIAVAYFTLVERKIMAGIQRRRGPDVVGAWGLIQPFADAAKLILKETILPSTANTVLFVIAPILSFMLSLVGWAVIPFGETFVLADINVGVLYLFAISSLGVYGIIMSGWASNSKYAFLGGLRSAAQMVSYEVSIGFILIGVILCAGSTNLSSIVMSQSTVWYGLPLFPLFFMFFISALAETNRHPFDLPEAEAELVAGYNVEYSAAGFALFFLGEYANMIMMSSITTIMFLGGWLPIVDVLPINLIPGPVWFGLKVCFFVALFVWARAAYPRYRYDQLMRLGWKVFLPLSLGWVLFIAGILIGFNWLPFII